MADQFITDISKFDKSTQETLAANAKSQGITAEEYLKSRGGINPVTRKYGDSYNPNVDLTDAEYQAAVASAKGKAGATAVGDAINAATKAKIEAYIKANPNASAAEVQKAINYGVLKSPEYTISSDGTVIYTGEGRATSTAKTAGTTPTGFNPSTGLYTASDGKTFSNADSYVAYQSTLDKGTAERKSAYDLLYQQFAKYGLQGLVIPLESLIKEGVPASEFSIRLRETDAYQKRFAANKARINKGLAALSEAEYIGLEDAYQGIMRQYGMPESYYTRGDMGRQEGFEKFIAGDVSPAELETRISTAYNRVINANPEVVQSLKQFYPNITNGDILSYVLDPEKGLTDINKKITAAEIGGAAIGAGLAIDTARAEQLGAFGVSKAQAQQGYQTIADILPSAKKLSDIYAKQGLGAYDQAVAEQEVFGISGATTAAQKRRKLAQLETAQFSGSTGVGALARERAGQF